MLTCFSKEAGHIYREGQWDIRATRRAVWVKHTYILAMATKTLSRARWGEELQFGWQL